MRYMANIVIYDDEERIGNYIKSVGFFEVDVARQKTVQKFMEKGKMETKRRVESKFVKLG